MKRDCVCCRRRFRPDPRVKGQTYCSRPECQKARRRDWQKKKLSQDEDYRRNQAEAQRRWRENNTHYWRKYRKEHPDYTRRNRELQRERNRRRRGRVRPRACLGEEIAKMDVNKQENLIIPGDYQLVLLDNQRIAKMDAIFVNLSLIPDSYDRKRVIAKR